MKFIGRLADIIIDLVYVVFTALSALILAVSLMMTVVFRQYEQNDLFDYEKENLPLLFLSMLAFFALLLAAYVYAQRKEKESGMSLSSCASAGVCGGHIDRNGAESPAAVPAGKAPFPWLMLAVAGAVSLFLAAAVRGLPTADAALLDEVIVQFAAGDYSGLESGYLRNYPFQIFYVYFGEILLNLFGEYDNLAWQLLNVIAIECFMYFLYQITWELFGSRTVCLVFQVLSCGAFCLYAFSTFIYLDLVSMAVQAAAMYLQILYMKRGRIRYEAAAGLCISAAILMKMNCLIALIAMIIFLFVDAIRKSIRNPGHTARRLLRAAALCAMLIAFTCAGSAALDL